MLKLRSIGLSDFAVFEGKQRIGRIRLAIERMPCVWLWNVTIPVTGGLPMGSSKDLDTGGSTTLHDTTSSNLRVLTVG